MKRLLAGLATVTAIAKSEARRGIHTVPITEQQLYVLARSGAIGDSLRAFSPSGPTPVADYPVLRLSSSQVTAEQSDGVAAFLEFAKQPDQTALLARSGYRAGDAQTPPGNATVGFGAVGNEMRDPEPAASAAPAASQAARRCAWVCRCHSRPARPASSAATFSGVKSFSGSMSAAPAATMPAAFAVW